MELAVRSFKKTGLWPLDAKAIDHGWLQPSTVVAPGSETPMAEKQTEAPSIHCQQDEDQDQDDFQELDDLQPKDTPVTSAQHPPRSSQQPENRSSGVSDAFQHLCVPDAQRNMRKRLRLPSAISGKKAMEMMQKKKEQKEKEAKERKRTKKFGA